MTLCVTYRTSVSRAVALSDSLLTTTKGKRDLGGFLPSDQEVVHQTPHAVKVHIASQTVGAYGERFDLLCAIAGNVSLGLQSILHLDAYLKGTTALWYDHIVALVSEKIHPFWDTARDQSLEMSFALNDHKGRIRLFELKAEKESYCFDEVQEEGGILLSVIGDNSSGIRSEILSQINRLSYEMDVSDAIHVSCTSKLNEKIKDPSSRFVDGGMQGAVLNSYLGDYLVIKDDSVHFRGAELDKWDSLDYPIMDLKSSMREVENA